MQMINQGMILQKTPCEICRRLIVWAGGGRSAHMQAHIRKGEAVSFMSGNGHVVYHRKGEA